MDGRGGEIIAEAVDPALSAIGAAPRPPPVAGAAPLQLGFAVELWDVGSGVATPVEALAVSGRYALRVVISSIATPVGAPSAKGFALRSPTCDLEVRCNLPELEIHSQRPVEVDYLGGPIVTLDRAGFSRDEVVVVDFELTVAPQFPSPTATIEILCATQSKSVVVSTLVVNVSGGRVAATQRELERFNVATTARVPDNVAFLHVTAMALDSPELMIVGVHATGRVDARIKLPKELSLARRLTSEVLKSEETMVVREARTLLADMSEFSRDQCELNIWMDGLLDYADPVVVVHDSTAHEVPWELFPLQRSFMGALVEVVRWTDVRNGSESLPLTLVEVELSGAAMTYLHSTGSIGTADENAQLQLLAARQCESMNEVLRCLNEAESLGDSGPRPSFLYIASHGEFVTDGGTRYLLDDSGPFAFDEVHAELLVPHEVRSLVVFVNACRSAQLTTGRDGRPRGLVERFLSRVAAGYIGTRADINNAQATAMGIQILQALSGARPARIANVLLQLRRRAIETFRPTSLVEEDWLRLMHAFSYVYFGDPLTCVQIAPEGLNSVAPGEIVDN